MGKIKLIALLAASVLSIYALNKASSAVTATDSTQLPLPGGATGLKSKTLTTTTVTPTAAELALIKAGTFTTSGTACPATPDCGTANTVPTKYGTASCPNICYVKATTGAAPPAGGPSYPVCPVGYAVINTGTMDLEYQQSPQLTRWPYSQAAMTSYQSTGYDCSGTDGSRQSQICEDPYHTNQGDYAQIGGYWSKAVYTECRANCSWSASSCGVAHVLMVTWEPVLCIRPAGNYPVESAYDPNGPAPNDPYYKMAPSSIICGHVRTSWIDS